MKNKKSITYKKKNNKINNKKTEKRNNKNIGGNYDRFPINLGINTQEIKLPNGLGEIIIPKNIDELYPNLKKINTGSGNMIKEIPQSFMKLRNLTFITLKETKLDKLPNNFGDIITLKSLEIFGSNLKKLPDSIGNLINLQNLHITQSNIKKLPDSIGNLINLQKLNIIESKLTTIPKSIGNLNNLIILILNDNKIINIPDELYTLIELNTLSLSDNNLENVPECISGMINLESLIFSNNKLKELPIFMRNLTKLRFLELDYNEIVTIPDIFNNLRKLEELLLNNNKINGTIPNTVANLPVLDTLSLENNERIELTYEFNYLMNRLTSVNFTIDNNVIINANSNRQQNNVRYLNLQSSIPVTEESYKRSLMKTIIAGDEEKCVILYRRMERENIDYNTKYSIFLDYPKEQNVHNTTLLLVACRFGMSQLAYLLASNPKVNILHYETYDYPDINDMCALDYAINKNMDDLQKLLRERTKEIVYKISGMVSAYNFERSTEIGYDKYTKGFDYINFEETTINEWLALKDTHFAVYNNKSYSLLDLEQLNNSMVDGSTVKYNCKKLGSISPENVDIKRPFYLLRGFGFPSGIMNANELLIMIMHITGLTEDKRTFSKERVFILEKTTETLISTVSLKVLVGANFVGTSHCQERQNEEVYKIKLPKI
jgi:Leucine-rich repeat (LRR) protein